MSTRSVEGGRPSPSYAVGPTFRAWDKCAATAAVPASGAAAGSGGGLERKRLGERATDPGGAGCSRNTRSIMEEELGLASRELGARNT